jgi:putative virulence-associated E|nr:MAG TPA: virulence associated protein E [Caudoviricetes sp.]
MDLDLDLDKNGRPLPSERNWLTLLTQDACLATVRKNRRSDLIEWSGELPPWRADGETAAELTDDDLVEVRTRLSLKYGFFAGSTTNVREHLSAMARRRSFDPVRDYLDGLPAWDCVERAETCLPGMSDDPQARRCLHLALTGAVARVYEPGCKFDHMVVLIGDQGVGKTMAVNSLFRGWVTELGGFGDRDDELRYTTAWCVMDDERVASLGAGNRAGEKYKAWLTAREYRGRAAYGHTTGVWRRSYVAWGATNDPNFLRAQEGNRRYLPIRLSGSTSEDLIRLQDAGFVAQVWAEARVWYERGDRMYIDRDSELPAHNAYLESFIDEGDDDLLSRVRHFLLTAVPADWNSWSLARQCDWWQSHEDAGSAGGGAAAVASSVEVPAVGDPPTRFVSREGAGLPDRVYSQQLLALLGVKPTPTGGERMMVVREMRRLGWVSDKFRVSGMRKKGYRPGPGWDEYVNEQKEAGLL